MIEMRWTPGGRSENLEDRRDQTGPGGMRLGGGATRLGLGGILILFVLSLIFKRDFFSLLNTGSAGMPPSAVRQVDPTRDAKEEPKVQFVSFVLDDAQNTSTRVFQASGAQYRDAKLVLFRDEVQSACGFAEAATGPFYCPGDQKVYIDLGFYDELQQRFGAAGDFAQAYVLAHEIGHHVQNLLGVEREVRRLQMSNPGARNSLSVRMELQADCFAGVWAHSTQQRNLLDQGDVEEALNAAAAIGDDRLQRMARGTVNPESFTHGSSAQRVEWFQRGFRDGSISSCNTFAN
jgi:predicted metalloprotease